MIRSFLIFLTIYTMPEVKPEAETFAKIKVVGVGGGGGNAINRMIEAGIKGVEFIAINTDVQALNNNKATEKLHIGKNVTKGLGAGMNPELGRQAAEESQNEIREALKGAHMVFVACGLGGGTGTGASPIVAQIARDLGALTIAIVTKPFFFEGGQRRRIAEEGYRELSSRVDTIITVSNEKLLSIIDKKTSLLDSFLIADNILRQGVQGIAEIITVPGIVNADFNDVKAIMVNTGSALMGIGSAKGENKAEEAVKAAINSNLLETSIVGARGIVFTITGGSDLTMLEVSQAAGLINQMADEDAKIIFGTIIDETMKDELKITIVATGFDKERPSEIEPETKYSANSFLKTEENLARSSQPSTAFTSPAAPIHASHTAPAAPASQPMTRPVAKPEEVKINPGWLETKAVPVSNASASGYDFRAASSRPATTVRKSEEDEEDEELSVPAFIRKKMN
jgi:cell division protein FtsZ